MSAQCHKWGIVERRIAGWGHKGAIFKTKVISRHKSQTAADQRPSKMSNYGTNSFSVRRLKLGE